MDPLKKDLTRRVGRKIDLDPLHTFFRVMTATKAHLHAMDAKINATIWKSRALIVSVIIPKQIHTKKDRK